MEQKLLVLNLRGEIEANVAEIADGILSGKRNVARHRQANRGRKRGSLGERNKLSQRERQSDFFRKINRGALALLHLEFKAQIQYERSAKRYIVYVGIGLDRDVAATDFASDAKLDTLFECSNDDTVTPLREICADPLELAGGHLDDRLILCVGNAQSFGVNIHKLELEIRNFI